jgi:CRISPR type III-B/RAMP module RAMP protein Cmr1
MSFSNIQERLLDRNKILDAVLTLISPARIGGYLGRPHSPSLKILESIRTSEIKGIWRWWTRILIATALYRRGYIIDDYNKLDELISLIVGRKKASLFEISLKLIRINKEQFDKVKEIPRIKLLSRLKSEERRKYRGRDISSLEILLSPDTEFETSILLRSREIEKNVFINDDVISFALYSFVIALLFSGIGSILTRGFGKVKINITKCYIVNLKTDLENIYNSVNENELNKNLNSLINKSITYANNYINFLDNTKEGKIILTKIIKESSSQITKQTRIPILDNNYFKFKILKVPSIKRIDEILKCIGKSTLKLEWKWYDYYGVTTEQKPFTKKDDYDRITKDKEKIYGDNYYSGIFHTWMLGMPRKGYDPYTSKTTGYEGIERRTSNVAFTIIKTANNVYYIAEYGFLTYDWTDRISNLIYYYDKGERKEYLINILNEDGILDPTIKSENKIKKPASLEDVFNTTFNTCFEVLKTCLEGKK